MIHSVRLVRNGSSLAVNVPPPLLRGLHWNRGDLLLVDVVGGALCMRRVDAMSVSQPVSAGTLGDRRRLRKR